jgi:hypothetical protein
MGASTKCNTKNNQFQIKNCIKEIKIITSRIDSKFEKKQANLVVIQLKTIKNKIENNYSDNRIDTNIKLKLYNGLQNVENRIKGIDGCIIFESKPDKRFNEKISVPK